MKDKRTRDCSEIAAEFSQVMNEIAPDAKSEVMSMCTPDVYCVNFSLGETSMNLFVNYCQSPFCLVGVDTFFVGDEEYFFEPEVIERYFNQHNLVPPTNEGIHDFMSELMLSLRKGYRGTL